MTIQRQIAVYKKPAQQDPLNMSGYRTQKPGSPEDFYQPLFDRVNYAAAGTSECNFFSAPLGASVTLIRAGATGTFNKTNRDTNIETPNVVPGKEFKIMGLSVGFVHEDEGEKANPIDRDKIRNGGYIKWMMGDKLIMTVPLMLLPESNPNVIASTTANDTTVLGAAGGGGPGTKMYSLGVPITLAPFQAFTIKAIFDGTVTTAKAVDIYMFLHAYMRRPG